MAKGSLNNSAKRICDRCGHENPKSVDTCESCNSARFAPQWVLAKRPINRQVSVEVTLSDPKYGEKQKRITLSKWWPGGNRSFHIAKPEQWNAIQDLVESLYPIIGWESKETHVRQLDESLKTGKGITKSLETLGEQHPELFLKIVQVLDSNKIAKQDIDDIISALGQQTDIMAKGTAAFREAYISVLEKLPKQSSKAFEQLERLLENWSLLQVTSVAQTVRSRLETIKLFNKQIHDDRTYEIRGDQSIHRILENAMWMIDEHYWLLQSNKSLREFIGDAMSKKDKKKYGKKRPDFVCGSVGNKLILVELKKPSKTLVIQDLDQLETYLSIAQSYSTQYRSYEAYLIGNKLDDDLIKRRQFRSSIFNIWTYSDLVDDSEKRYKEFLKFVES
jgi:ribosomal protein L40E